jgi:hypothetical protein
LAGQAGVEIEERATNRYADTTSSPATARANLASGRWKLPLGSLVVVDDADQLPPQHLRYLIEKTARTNTKLLLISDDGREPAHSLTPSADALRRPGRCLPRRAVLRRAPAQPHQLRLSISGKNVLAFSSSLDWNIERVKGGSIATGGLFNTTLRGTGWVALTTDGPPVVLNAAEAPTFADTKAVVAWSANLQTQLKTSFKAGALIGRGAGEAVQVSFHGNGFVLVQPSEGFTVAAQ